MTILDRANAFIGHKREVDEGLETYMRREAFIAGFKEALWLVKEMREAQKDVIYKSVFSPLVPTEAILYEVAKTKQIILESEVDELIKEMEGKDRRKSLEAENTEFDYGHNVKHYSED